MSGGLRHRPCGRTSPHGVHTFYSEPDRAEVLLCEGVAEPPPVRNLVLPPTETAERAWEEEYGDHRFELDE